MLLVRGDLPQTLLSYCPPNIICRLPQHLCGPFETAQDAEGFANKGRGLWHHRNCRTCRERFTSCHMKTVGMQFCLTGSPTPAMATPSHSFPLLFIGFPQPSHAMCSKPTDVGCPTPSSHSFLPREPQYVPHCGTVCRSHRMPTALPTAAAAIVGP